MIRVTLNETFGRALKCGAIIAGALSITLALSPMAAADGGEKPAVKEQDRAATPSMSAAEGLPKPDALYAKYVKAIGGEKALRRHTSFRATGTWSMPAMGMEGEFTIHAAEPHYYLLELNAPGMGKIRSGFDGKVGWMDGDMTGASLLEEGDLAQTKVDADFYYPLNFHKHYREMETVEVTEFAGEQCYHVRGTRHIGDRVSIYFAKETGLLMGTSGVRSSDFGDINTLVIHSDYKEVGGVKLPHKMKMSMPDMAIEQHFRTRQWAFGGVDKSVFALPETIQRLVDRKKQAEEDAEDDRGE